MTKTILSISKPKKFLQNFVETLIKLLVIGKKFNEIPKKNRDF